MAQEEELRPSSRNGRRRNSKLAREKELCVPLLVEQRRPASIAHVIAVRARLAITPRISQTLRECLCVLLGAQLRR